MSTKRSHILKQTCSYMYWVFQRRRYFSYQKSIATYGIEYSHNGERQKLLPTPIKVNISVHLTLEKINIYNSISWKVAVRRCSWKKMFCKNFATEKHLCWSLFLIKVQAWRSSILWKRDPNTGVFMWIFWNIWEQLFL